MQTVIEFQKPFRMNTLQKSAIKEKLTGYFSLKDLVTINNDFSFPPSMVENILLSIANELLMKDTKTLPLRLKNILAYATKKNIPLKDYIERIAEDPLFFTCFKQEINRLTLEEKTHLINLLETYFPHNTGEIRLLEMMGL